MHDSLSDIFSPLPGCNKLNELTYLSALVLSFPYCRSMVDSFQPKLSISALFTTQMSSSCEENFVFVLERPEKCSDLFDYIDESDYLSENERRQFISNILDANIHCEGYGVLHQDIKPEYIIIDSFKMEAKRIDFGLVNDIQDTPFRRFVGKGCTTDENTLFLSFFNYTRELY